VVNIQGCGERKLNWQITPETGGGVGLWTCVSRPMGWEGQGKTKKQGSWGAPWESSRVHEIKQHVTKDTEAGAGPKHTKKADAPARRNRGGNVLIVRVEIGFYVTKLFGRIQ